MRSILGVAAMLATILSLSGCLTGAQTAALTCGLANDGATVIAIYKPGAAPKASASAQVACDAGTQVGALLAAPK